MNDLALAPVSVSMSLSRLTIPLIDGGSTLKAMNVLCTAMVDPRLLSSRRSRTEQRGTSLASSESVRLTAVGPRRVVIVVVDVAPLPWLFVFSVGFAASAAPAYASTTTLGA